MVSMIMMGDSPEGTPRRSLRGSFAGFFASKEAKKTGGSRAPVESLRPRKGGAMMLRVRAGTMHSAEALYSGIETGQGKKTGFLLLGVGGGMHS